LRGSKGGEQEFRAGGGVVVVLAGSDCVSTDVGALQRCSVAAVSVCSDATRATSRAQPWR
jgi:hypothetical protein